MICESVTYSDNVLCSLEGRFDLRIHSGIALTSIYDQSVTLPSLFDPRTLITSRYEEHSADSLQPSGTI
jgi:hypothetical protein